MFIQINDSFCNHFWSNSVFLSDSAIKRGKQREGAVFSCWGHYYWYHRNKREVGFFCCCLFVFYSNIIINWSQYSETVSWFMSFFHFVKDHCSKVFFTFEQTMISFCKWYHFINDIIVCSKVFFTYCLKYCQKQNATVAAGISC